MTSAPLTKRVTAALLSLMLLLGTLPAAMAATAPSINASGAIVMDYQTGEVYYNKNADVARPAASMTKVMSMYLVFEEIAAGRLSLDTYVTAGSYAAGISNNRAFSGLEQLRSGGSYKVDDLIKVIMTESCNGSVIVLAEHIGGTEAAFVQRMNDKAAEWGIDAHFADCCGFEDDGNAVSPRAMATIARRIIADYPQILDYSSLTSVYFNGKTFYSTNSLLRNGSVDGIDGLKTGTTNGAGYCFTGTAIRDGKRIISVVMNTTSYSARMSESQRLLEYGFACRAEREVLWAQDLPNLTLTMGTASGSVYPYVENALMLSVSGIQNSIPCTVQWELNGEAMGEATDRVLTPGGTFSTPLVVPAGADAITPAAVLTLPDGSQRRIEETYAPEPALSFSGRMDMRLVEMYTNSTLMVPVHVQCDQGLSFTVPAGWYLDGQPIPYYQNPAFALSPAGSSTYTLNTAGYTPGPHTLEFRVNPQGLPGVKSTNFVLNLQILDPAQNAA